MATVTVRSLSEVAHQALKMRAACNHRSLAAEIRAILDDAVSPKRRVKGANPSPSKVKVGSELAAFGRRFGGINPKID